MEIKSLVIGELQTDCYLVWDKETKEGLIIDPGDDANFVSEQVLGLNFQPMSIVATHGHFDHLLAADELSMAFDIPLLVHEKDLFLVKDLQKRAEHWLGRKIIEKPPANINYLASKGHLFRGWQARVVWTPGHTPGSICLYFPKDNILFTGDTLFADGIGSTNHSYSSKKDLNASLKKLFRLPPATIIYPGHGSSTTLVQALKRG